MNKKALSPLVATILLVVFALVIGTITMSWGKAYVEKAEEKPEEEGPVIVIPLKIIDNELKELQIDYIIGRISKEEYLEEEKELIKR